MLWAVDPLLSKSTWALAASYFAWASSIASAVEPSSNNFNSSLELSNFDLAVERVLAASSNLHFAASKASFVTAPPWYNW